MHLTYQISLEEYLISIVSQSFTEFDLCCCKDIQVLMFLLQVSEVCTESLFSERGVPLQNSTWRKEKMFFLSLKNYSECFVSSISQHW